MKSARHFRINQLLFAFCSLLLMNSLHAENLFAEDTYIGIIEPRKLIKIGSPSWGIVEDVPVNRGDRIEQGALLTQLNADVEKLELSLAKTRMHLAESRYKRQLALEQNNLVSDEDAENAKTELELNKLEVRRREILLRQKTIKSPVPGVVTETLVSSGEYVYEQTPVVVVAQIDPLNVELILPFSEFGRIKPGMRAEVIPQEPINGRYVAEVEVIDKVMDAASATFGVRLKLANPDQTILSGIKCGVRFLDDSITLSAK